MYLGMPYAVVHDDRPFGASSPHPPYTEEIFEAVNDSAMCPQLEDYNKTIAGSLDCLNINVYVPTTASPTNKRPVFVYIHGGRFHLGFHGRYVFGPKFLMRHDIIIVNLYYRLGAFGFMCLDHPDVPGNQGLKDQLIALQWVKDNIENFNGDPNRITLAGNSAGGMSVDFQILNNIGSPRLFDQVILQSGTVEAPSFPSPDRNAPLTLAQYLGLQTDDISEALQFLSNVDPLSVVEAVISLDMEFRPCVEKKFEGVENLIAEDFVAIEDIPSVRGIPIMMGFNDDEGLTNFAIAGNNRPNVVRDTLGRSFYVNHEEFDGMTDIVSKFFFGDEEVNDGSIRSSIDMSSDLSFVHPTHRSLEKFLRNRVEKVYLYLFSYVGERNYIKQALNITIGGATHADEVTYLFDNAYMEEPTPEDQLIIDRMTMLWANFVKYGDPTPTPSALVPYSWLPITTGSSYHVLNIDSEVVVTSRPLHDRMAFWDLFYEANGHLRLPSGQDLED